MQEKEIFTVEQLKSYLESNLSERRYKHVVAVAETTERILEHYGCKNFVPEWNGFSAGYFCGLAHDISRELGAEEWFRICRENSVEISREAVDFPVLLHGYVSSIMIKKMFPDAPSSWLRAIEVHTVGDDNMDDLALAVFIADYIEPNRTYLTDAKRSEYLSCPTIKLCAYSVLCDIIKHLQSKDFPVSRSSILMKEYLERL